MKLSSLAKDLEPYLIKLIRNIVGDMEFSSNKDNIIYPYAILLFDSSVNEVLVFPPSNAGRDDAVTAADTGDIILFPPGSGFYGLTTADSVDGDYSVAGYGKYVTTFSRAFTWEYGVTGDVFMGFLSIDVSYSSTSSTLTTIGYGGTGRMDIHDVYINAENDSNGKAHGITASNTGDIHVWGSTIIVDPASGEGYITRCNDNGAEIHLHDCVIDYKTGIDNTSGGNVYLYNCVDLADSGNIIWAKYSGGSLVWKRTKKTAGGGIASTPDEITATSDGVAASVDTLSTEVTTNGDQDLDNVTLANGISGQIKHIYCVAVGDASDTWKVTPASLLGGTQITFSGAGEGCTLIYADNEGWIIIGNNGGTIA